MKTSVLGAMLLAAALPAAGGDTPAPGDHVVVLLHANDLLRAGEVVQAIGGCPTVPSSAVVSFHDGLKLEQDFTTDADQLRRASAKASVGGEGGVAAPSAAFSLAGRLPGPSAKGSRSILDALRSLADAVAPIGRGTTVVLLSKGVPMGERRGIGPESGTRPIEHDTALLYGEGPGGGGTFTAEHMNRAFIETRTALAKSGIRVVAVNVGERYSPGLKALSEATDGRYLQVGREESAAAALGASLCR